MPNAVGDTAYSGLNAIRNELVRTAASHQNALDIFKGEWVVSFPPETGLQAGSFPGEYFNDIRIHMAAEHLGGFQNRTVLELGPYEGHHSSLMEKFGASSVTAIEANTRAFLKCLITKEALGLRNVHFLLGDALQYMRQTTQRFDIIMASGFLYHLTRPDVALRAMGALTNRIFIQTHYYDADLIANSLMAGRFFEAPNGGKYRYFRMNYLDQDSPIYLGGNEPHTHWIERYAILEVLEEMGFEIRLAYDETVHANGPSIAFSALRKSQI